MTVFASLLLVILIVFGLFAFGCNLLFWYESRNSPEPQIPQPVPGFFLCIFRYCKTLIFSMTCVVLALLQPFLRKRINSPRRADADLPPLVLIHGYGTNAGCWLYLAHKFRKAGYPVSAFVYRSINGSPERIISDLGSLIQTLEHEPGSRKPVLIGHSLGGLIARAWLKDETSQQRIQGLITLGTPHGGSKLAVLGLGRLATTLRPDSDFIRALQQAPPLAPPCVALAGPGDESVLPPSHLLPPDSWQFHLAPPAGHFGMLFHPQIASMILQELESILSRQT